MSENLMGNLRDCSQFRQTLLARPPKIVHGTAILLLILIIAAFVWASLTQASLVVRAPGRVRPENRVSQVFVPESVNRAGYTVSGRVEEVLYQEGMRVTKGEVLLRLGTSLLEEERAKLELTIQTFGKELDRLEEENNLLSQRYAVARAKAEIELLEAEEEVRLAEQTKAIKVQRADAEHRQMLALYDRVEKLRSKQVVSDLEAEEAELKVIQARAELDLARQPIQKQKVEIRRRALELVERDYALRRKELEVARTKKQAEIERAQKQLATVRRQLESAVLRSPINGVVVTKEVKVGDVLKRGAPVVEIAEPKVLYFEAMVSSKDASHLRQGMPVQIKLDAYDHHWYGTLPARVEFISPDSRVAENGKRKHLGYEVRIALERHELQRGDLRGEVKLGLTGMAEIVTERKSILSILRKNIRRSISLG